MIFCLSIGPTEGRLSFGTEAQCAADNCIGKYIGDDGSMR